MTLPRRSKCHQGRWFSVWQYGEESGQVTRCPLQRFAAQCVAASVLGGPTGAACWLRRCSQFAVQQQCVVAAIWLGADFFPAQPPHALDEL